MVGSSFRRRLWFIAVPVASLVLIPVLLFAAQRPTAAASTVLTIFTGVAEVARGNADFAVASDGAILAASDRVRTDDRGHALITFFDGSTLELEPATTVQIDTASPSATGSIEIDLSQAIGRTWASVQKLTRTDSKFEIKTPTSTASVRGTGFLTEVLANGETTVQTTDGTVAVTGQGQTVLVTQGLQTTVRRNEAPTTPAAMPTPSTTLRFGMHSPAYLVVIDPLGRSCGITSGALVVRHIPGCVASAPGSEPQLIDLPDAVAGTYRTVIASIDPGGPFTLTATGIDDRGNVSFDLSLPGDGKPGAVFGSALDVQAGPDGRLSASALAALVTLQSPPSPSDSPSPTSAASASPNVVPDLALPVLPIASATPTATEAATPAPTPTATPAPEPRTPSPASTPAPTPTATPSPTPSASASPSQSPSATPAPTPTTAQSPSPQPTPAPTSAPTAAPTPAPTPASTPNPQPTAGCTPSGGQPNKCTSAGP